MLIKCSKKQSQCSNSLLPIDNFKQLLIIFVSYNRTQKILFNVFSISKHINYISPKLLTFIFPPIIRTLIIRYNKYRIFFTKQLCYIFFFGFKLYLNLLCKNSNNLQVTQYFLIMSKFYTKNSYFAPIQLKIKNFGQVD